ncbi:hypothetical protein KIPB_004233, partial [Kipferlia bialata]
WLPTLLFLRTGVTALVLTPLCFIFIAVFRGTVPPIRFRRLKATSHSTNLVVSLCTIGVYVWDLVYVIQALGEGQTMDDLWYHAYAVDLWYTLLILLQIVHLAAILVSMTLLARHSALRTHASTHPSAHSTSGCDYDAPSPSPKWVRPSKLVVLPVIVAAYALSYIFRAGLVLQNDAGDHILGRRSIVLCLAMETLSICGLIYPNKGSLTTNSRYTPPPRMPSGRDRGMRAGASDDGLGSPVPVMGIGNTERDLSPAMV